MKKGRDVRALFLWPWPATASNYLILNEVSWWVM